MKSNQKKFKNSNEYISSFPEDIQIILHQIRETIRKAAPKAEEVISYQIPAFKQKSVLVYFAAFKNHIGFYPTANPIKVFAKELSTYKTSKGAIQFPLDKKIPLALVSKITKFRVKEDLEKHSSFL
jgi:uncharacterized protein YdhG (YjbR/CyaY superfamily)